MPVTVPGISIVVPFYNIASVARRCVESLLDQTIPAAELVLVDDGSTDGTGELLDSLADGDRVRVFHQANAGISAARNLGVAESRSDFISFVDGDDVVSPRYVEALTVALSGALASGSEMPLISADGIVLRDDRAEGFPFAPATGELRVLTREESVLALCRGELSCTAWAKVAPRELYERMPFPLGKVYEDWHVVGHHMLGSDCIVHVPEAIYGHVMRSGSITNRSWSLADAADYLEAIDAFERATGDLALPDPGARRYHRCLQLARTYSCLERAALEGGRPEDADAPAIERVRAFYPEVASAQECREAIRTEIAGLLHDINRDPLVSGKDKLRFRLLASSPSAYDWAYRGYGALVKGVRR